MPDIARGESTHLEGENVRTLARMVYGTEQAMLDAGSAGPLTVKIQSQGRVLYHKTFPATQNGIIDPQKPAAWSKRGMVNFNFVHDASTLAANSPSFRFLGGRSYLIEYDFDTTTTDGHVFAHHIVRIKQSP